MKKAIPYVLVSVLALLLIWIILAGRKNARSFDERLSFNKRDKIPYGLYVAYNNLGHIFPAATISVNKKEPGFWDSLSTGSGKQALIIITPAFMADEFELNRLLNFAKNGNEVFISARVLSQDVRNFFNCESYPFEYYSFDDMYEDTLNLSLLAPPFPAAKQFSYPGRRYAGYLTKYDKHTSYQLGKREDDVNFIKLKAGAGNIYLHLAPIAFSNFFLLHGKNIDYYEQVLSLMPKDLKTVVWDEYYLHKRGSGQGEKKSMLSALMSQRSFRVALWLIMLFLFVYILQEARRKQRIIPSMPRPTNDSLEFVKTIGRLYYEKRDNKNLSRKMAAYFLEHVRNRYKLPTSVLDEKFIAGLKMKTGQSDEAVRRLVSFIRFLGDADHVSDEQLAEFHGDLEEFYRTS